MADLAALLIVPALVVPMGMALIALARRMAGHAAIRPSIRQGLIVAPALAYGVWAARLILDLMRDPTSHNLWPLEMGLVLVMWLVWIGTVALVLAMTGWRRGSS